MVRIPRSFGIIPMWVLLQLTVACGRGPVEQAPEARHLTDEAQQLNQWFAEASEDFDVPVEVLQGVAFVESRWRHLVPDAALAERFSNMGGCASSAGTHEESHMPPTYGVMGLRHDCFFGTSLVDAAALIGSTPEALKADPRLNIRGAAALLARYAEGKSRTDAPEEWEDAVARYSGIPYESIARMHTYDVFNAILLGRESEHYKVQQRPVSLLRIYGEEQLKILSGPQVVVRKSQGDTQAQRSSVTAMSADYGPAIFNAAATCNYTAGRSAAITHIAEHITEGSYASAISWFKDCASGVSAHYVIRSSDGQVTQMVAESNTAHHVANHNSYSVGIEHEGISSNCAWYTDALYNASAALTRDIADSHRIPRTAVYDASLGWDTELPQSSPFKIKGHTNFPTAKTCPGRCWDWPRFRSLVIGTAQPAEDQALLKPATVSKQPGQLNTFIRGTDGAIWDRWWTGSEWTAWQSLGGNNKYGPAAVSVAPGTVDVYSVGTDNALWHKHWNGTVWSNWETRGGTFTSGPAAVSLSPGAVHLYARGSDNAIWQKFWNGTQWSNWESLGGTLTSGPAAVSLSPGTVQVYARGTDNAIYQKSYNGTQWSNWESLGGNLTSGPGAVSMSAGTVHVYARGGDNAIWQKFWNGTMWSNWETLGGTFTSGPAAGSLSPGTLHVQARGADNSVWQKSWSGTEWSAWQNLGGSMK